MSGKEDLIPGLTDQIPEKPTCSLTQPHSLIDGCIDGMKSAATDPGYVIAGGGVAAGTAAILKKNIIGSVLSATGAEGLVSCGGGIINTAIKNCNETDPNKLNPSSILDHKTTEPLIPTTQPAPSGVPSVMFESKMPPIPPLAAANEPPSSSLTPLPSSSVGPSISNSSIGNATHNFAPVPGLDNPVIPPIVPIPTLEPLPASTTDSSLMGTGIDSHLNL